VAVVGFVADPASSRWSGGPAVPGLAPDLIAKIEDYLAAHNNDPKPFVWTATADDVLAKVARGRIALQAVNQ